MKTSKIYLLLLIALLCFSSSEMFAKRVVCISAGGDGFLSSHEGYERSILKPGDEVRVGGDLEDCLALLQNGDTLVIVAHGNRTGQRFKWGNTFYTGFGNPGDECQGNNPIPIPAGLGGIENLVVDFCSCWSTRDPDGDGPNKSLADKLKLKLAGDAEVRGFNDLAVATMRYYICANGGVQTSAIRKKNQ